MLQFMALFTKGFFNRITIQWSMQPSSSSGWQVKNKKVPKSGASKKFWAGRAKFKKGHNFDRKHTFDKRIFKAWRKFLL